MSEGDPGSPRNNSSAMSHDGFPKGKRAKHNCKNTYGGIFYNIEFNVNKGGKQNQFRIGDYCLKWALG